MKKKLIVMAALTVITVIMVTLFFASKAPQALGSVWGVREVLISAPLLFVLFGLMIAADDFSAWARKKITGTADASTTEEVVGLGIEAGELAQEKLRKGTGAANADMDFNP